ncbi:hypothetical protein KCU88_g3055, partial [Aureobasidium melanogenum]
MATESCYNFAKLQELARLECVSELSLRPALGRLTSADVPSFATAEHEHQASELLARGKISNSLLRTVRRLDSRTYTSITELLPSAIEQDETAGLAQALLRLSPGLEAIKKAEKREDQIRRREALLDEAVQKNNIAAVWLLASACSQSGRDRALTVAVRRRKSKKIILNLLQYGADPGRCKEEFLEACQTGDHDLVATLLQGPSSISPMVLFDALTTATRSGDIQILSLLTQAADLSTARDLEAVSEAVRSARLDMLLRLLLSAKALDPRVLDHLIGVVFRMSGTEAAVRLRMLDALFYAGASGETAASCLADAVSRELMDFVHIFIKHRVDINWSEGKAAVNAAQTGRSAVLKTVLAGRGLLAENASRALGSLPAYVSPEERRVITELLLDAGARGSAVDHELILAVKRNDETAVDMLLQRGASVDRGGGKALIEAIKQERVVLVHRVLSCPTNNESLSKAFPSTRAIQKAPRLDITKLLLKAGGSGEAVDAALRDAVCDMSEDRDDILIAALIQGGADPAFCNAQSLRHAIETHDVKLLRDLMRGPMNVSEGLASALLDDIMKLGERDIGYSMIQEAIRDGANISSVSNALIAELSRCTCASGIIKLLLGRGRADVDHDRGKALVLAALQAHTDNLMVVLSSPTVSRQSVEKGLCAMLESRKFDDGQKAARAEIILERTKPSETSANAGFSGYVKFCKSAVSKSREWPLETFKVLVRFGADINTDNGSTFASIVELAAIPLMTYILSSATLRKDNADRALLCCVGLTDTCDRSEALRMLLGCRPTNEGASIALIEATRRGFVEVVQPLLQYGAMADFQDDVPIREAASRGNAALLSLFLEAKVARRSLRAAFQVAAQLVDPESRFECIKTILSAGLRGDVVDLYLVGLLAGRTENDILYWAMSQNDPRIKTECLQVLIQHGANVNYRDPNTKETLLLLAMRTGRIALMKSLVAAGVDVSAANDRGHSPLLIAIELGSDVIAETLIEAGANPNDGSLHQAARALQPKLLKALLRQAANPNYHSRVHGGRTPLAEVCASTKVTSSSYQDAIVVFTELVKSGADIEERVDRKPLICIALDNPDPVMAVQALISTRLSDKRIDEDFNLYEQGGMMYPPTYYVFKGIFQGQRTQAGELVELLLRYGANRDVYYSLRGPQPPDAVGMPAPIAEKEAKRLARAERIAEEEADHRRKMQRADEEEARLRRIEQQQHALRYERNEELATQTLQHARLMNLVEQERKAADIEDEQLLRKIRWQRDQDRLQLQQSEYEEAETHRERLCIMDTLAIQQRKALELQNRRDFDEVEREAIKYKASIVEELAEREHGRKTELLALMSTEQLGLEEPDGGGYIEGLEESESESE